MQFVFPQHVPQEVQALLQKLACRLEVPVPDMDPVLLFEILKEQAQLAQLGSVIGGR
jgi:hypothetical protein